MLYYPAIQRPNNNLPQVLKKPQWKGEGTYPGDIDIVAQAASPSHPKDMWSHRGWLIPTTAHLERTAPRRQDPNRRGWVSINNIFNKGPTRC